MTIRQISTVACWVAIVGGFVLSFSTWLALGVLSGFGLLALALPLCVDGYMTTALTAWLTPNVSDRLARFARNNLYATAVIGVVAQAAYHGASVHSLGNPDWKTSLATIVGGFPMAIATLAVHIKARTVRELEGRTTQPATPELQKAPATALASPAPSIGAPARQPGLLSAPLQPVVAPAQPAPHESQSQAQPVTAAVKPAAARPTASPQPKAGAAERTTPRHKVKESGSGPRPTGVSLEDVRRWVDADGLTHLQVADRLGVSPRTATRRIAEARAAVPRLVALP